MTRNQILAAVLSFVTLAMMLLLGPLGRMVSWAPAAAVFRYIDLFGQMEEFGRGIVDSRRFVYHLSLVAVALFAATRALAAGRATSLRRRALVEVALAALIAVGVNYLGARHYAARRLDARPHLRAVGQDRPRSCAAFRATSTSSSSCCRPAKTPTISTATCTSSLERMRRLSPHLHVEYVDIDREPERLKTVGKKYGVSGDDLVDGVIVVAAGDQSKFVTRNELADYDYARRRSRAARRR